MNFYFLVPEYIATGWGATDDAGTTASSHLMKVNLPGFDTDTCAKVYGSRIFRRLIPAGIQKETQICVGGLLDKDSCRVSYKPLSN